MTLCYRTDSIKIYIAMLNEAELTQKGISIWDNFSGKFIFSFRTAGILPSSCAKKDICHVAAFDRLFGHVTDRFRTRFVTARRGLLFLFCFGKRANFVLDLEVDHWLPVFIMTVR